MDEKVEGTDNPQATPTMDPKLTERIKRVDEYLNVEEITVVYRGVRQPQNTSQAGIEINALKNLTKVIEQRITSIENDWSFIIERQRLVNELVKQEHLNEDVPSPPATE
jgi:hypothetical protein